MNGRLAVFMVGGVLFSSAASAGAVLFPEQGKTSVNFGAGYEGVAGRTPVIAGDKVMVSSKGVAKIVFDDNCTIAVYSGSVVVVPKDRDCKDVAAAQNARAHIGFGAPLFAAGGAAGASGLTVPIIAGGGVAGATGLVLSSQRSSGRRSYASP